LVADISECRDLIPPKYLESHDFEEDDGAPVSKNRIYKVDRTIPIDLAFCRWMAMEYKVIMMPICLFYNENSSLKTDRYVRMTICKGLDHTKKVITNLKNN
jgi:aspartate/methionine/tyrosine aminotransferase